MPRVGSRPYRSAHGRRAKNAAPHCSQSGLPSADTFGIGRRIATVLGDALRLGASLSGGALLAGVATVSPAAVPAGRHEPPAMVAMCVRSLAPRLAASTAGRVKSTAKFVGSVTQAVESLGLVNLRCRILVVMTHLG